jgi:hypothetical protein
LPIRAILSKRPTRSTPYIRWTRLGAIRLIYIFQELKSSWYKCVWEREVLLHAKWIELFASIRSLSEEGESKKSARGGCVDGWMEATPRVAYLPVRFRHMHIYPNTTLWNQKTANDRHERCVRWEFDWKVSKERLMDSWNCWTSTRTSRHGKRTDPSNYNDIPYHK